MFSISTVSDIGEGVCPVKRHGKYVTTYVAGADSVFINNSPVVRVSDVGNQSCGHTSTALTGSGSVFVEGMGVHRVSDVGEGGAKDVYTSLTGSDNVFAGD